MMASRDITLWIDERWYEALEQNGIAVEDKLNEFIDILVNQLPEDVYKRVSHELWEDEQERAAGAGGEAALRRVQGKGAR